MGILFRRETEVVIHLGHHAALSGWQWHNQRENQRENLYGFGQHWGFTWTNIGYTQCSTHIAQHHFLGKTWQAMTENLLWLQFRIRWQKMGSNSAVACCPVKSGKGPLQSSCKVTPSYVC